jgi:hypothetical protein
LHISQFNPDECFRAGLADYQRKYTFPLATVSNGDAVGAVVLTGDSTGWRGLFATRSWRPNVVITWYGGHLSQDVYSTSPPADALARARAQHVMVCGCWTFNAVGAAESLPRMTTTQAAEDANKFHKDKTRLVHKGMPSSHSLRSPCVVRCDEALRSHTMVAVNDPNSVIYLADGIGHWARRVPAAQANARFALIKLQTGCWLEPSPRVPFVPALVSLTEIKEGDEICVEDTNVGGPLMLGAHPLFDSSSLASPR